MILWISTIRGPTNNLQKRKLISKEIIIIQVYQRENILKYRYYFKRENLK